MFIINKKCMEFGAYIQNNKNVLGRKSVLGHFFKCNSDIICQLYFKKSRTLLVCIQIFVCILLGKNTKILQCLGVFSKIVVFLLTIFYTISFHCTSILMEPKLEYWKVPKEGCNLFPSLWDKNRSISIPFFCSIFRGCFRK